MNMTMFFDSEIDRIFKRMSASFFNADDVFEKNGPSHCYGYAVTVGPDGRPVVREFGDCRPDSITAGRELAVDTIVDEKQKVVKLIAEMPGVEKTDVKIVVEDKTVDVSAERGEKKYHAKVPLQHKVDEGSARASYKNGILELVFKLEEKAAGKTVEVQ